MYWHSMKNLNYPMESLHLGQAMRNLQTSIYLFTAWMLIFTTHTHAQNTKQPKEELLGNRIFEILFHYTYTEPEGDLISRFGYIHNMGTGVMYKTTNHWMASWELSYQYGTIVKEPNLLSRLTNSSGVISNTSGYEAEFSVGQRGLSSFVKVGRFIPTSYSNRNTGFVVTLGGGYYIHKIQINTRRNDIATLTPNLIKGYDRLTAGPALSQFIGYMHHSKNRFYNFYIGIETVQAFTKSLRGYNYDQMAYDNESRLDMTYGIRLGWTIPIYLNSKKQDEFYFR